ncbi:MAG: O-methyltransferase [archaeon]
MNQKTEKVLRKIEKLEENNSWGSIPCSTAKFLHILVLATKSKNILELGCSLGYSAIWIALAAKKFEGHVYTTEIDAARIKQARENFEASGLGDHITLFEKDIIEVLTKWNEGEVDFVFIDAKKEDYLKYYELALPLLKKGGLILADDVGKFKDQVRPFLDKVNNDSGVVSQFLELDDGLMLVYKK